MENDAEKLHQHNGKYYVGNGDDCLPWEEYVRLREAAAWDKGFDSGEADVFQHDEHGWSGEHDDACIKNPFED